jgi:arylsulfatase A-like enzyme
MSNPTPPSVDDPDVSDAPAWVRDRPMPDQEQVDAWREDRRRAYEALRGVDDAVGKVVDTLRRLDELDDTVIVFMTDNGFAFGEHRWFAKSCPYDECIRTPFFVRYPGATAHVDDHLVSNVDVAPTLAQLAGVRPGSAVDGRSLLPLLDGAPTSTWRAGVLCGFEGDADVPAWWELRTRRYAYVEYATGEHELYDLRSDPWELSNLARSRRTSALRARLSATLASLRAAP